MNAIDNKKEEKWWSGADKREKICRIWVIELTLEMQNSDKTQNYENVSVDRVTPLITRKRENQELIKLSL